MDISYKKNSNNVYCIYDHLKKVSSLYTPSLDIRVDLKEYALKLNDKAINLEAWHNDILIGLVSYYLNEQQNEVFVTNVSVLKEFQGVGIASKLLNILCEDQDVKKKSRIRLYASSKDEKLLRFYKKRGFYLSCKSDDQNEMIYRLQDVIPIVSICCVTYNHERYIRQCLDGFIMQKINFPIEILVHDDASTDHTADIIREYEEKFPEILKPIFQTDNQFSKGVPISYTYNWPRVKGKYIAMCEGDDFWTDPYKLQKQVDFMEKHESYSMCFHNVKRLLPEGIFEDGHIAVKRVDNTYSVEDVIMNESHFALTNTMLFRSEFIKDLPQWMIKAPVGDYPLKLYLATKGSLYYFDKIMSVYRVHSVGSWSVSVRNRDKRKKLYHGMMMLWSDFDKWTKKKYHRFIVNKKRSYKFLYYKQYLFNTLKRVASTIICILS